jgi:Putative exporter of polyketide antibiotics
MKTNPTMARLIGHAAVASANRVVVLSFASTLTIIFAVVASIPAMMTILRLNTDERKGYLEQLHARGVSRLRIFGTHMLFATLVGTATLVLGIIGMGIAGNATLAHPIDLSRYLRGFVGYWPALFVIIGITALIVSLVPRLQSLAWLLPVYGFFSLYLGELLNLPEWAQKLSPYGWVNQVPLKTIDWSTAGWMTGLGFILIIIAYIIYRHRDLKIN